MRKLAGQLLSLGFSPTAKHTYWVLAGDAVFTLTTLLATVIIARALLPAHFGVFVVLLTLLIIILDVADIGVGNSLSHFIPSYMAKGEEEKAWSIVKTAFFFELSISSIILVVSFFSASFLSSLLFNTQEYSFLIRLMSGQTVLALWTVLLGYVLSAFERFPQRALLVTLPAVVRLIIFFVLYLTGLLNLSTAVIVGLVSFIPSLFLGLFFIGSAWITAPVSFHWLGRILSFSSFLGVGRALAAFSSRLDVIMLSAMVGSLETGIYAAASRMTLIYPMVAGSFSAVLAPKFARLKGYHEIISFFKKVTLASMLLMSSAIVLAFLADFLVMLIFGKQYQYSVSVFRWLMIPNMIFLATIPTVNLIIFRLKKPAIFSLVSFFQLIIIVVANLLLIPRLGRVGPIPGLTLAFTQVFLITGVTSYVSLQKMKHDENKS